nr:hypothetical protein [Tanacetum cinerariifolium]
MGCSYPREKYCLEPLCNYGLLACKPAATPMQQNVSLNRVETQKDKKLKSLNEYQKLVAYALTFAVSFYCWVESVEVFKNVTRCRFLCVFLWKFSLMEKQEASYPFKDLNAEGLLPILLYCDCTSAIQIAVNLVFHEKTKHIEIDVHFVREKVAFGVISTEKCFIRVPFNQFRSLRSVCKAWKDEIELSELLALRKSTGKAQSLVVMSQARVNLEGERKGLVTSMYHLVVLDPETGFWWDMPPLPGFENGLPLFCEMVCVGSDLVVIGGSFFGCASDGDHMLFVAGGHDLEKNALKSVWMYDVPSDKWGQLRDMTKEREECRGLFHHGNLELAKIIRQWMCFSR